MVGRGGRHIGRGLEGDWRGGRMRWGRVRKLGQVGR